MLRPSYFGLAGALLHVLALAYTVHLVLARNAPDWPMYWMLFLALDFPLSLAVLPVAWLVPASGGGPLSDLTNFWWPLAFHGIVGTAWWYVVGLAIERRVCPRPPAEATAGETSAGSEAAEPPSAPAP